MLISTKQIIYKGIQYDYTKWDKKTTCLIDETASNLLAMYPELVMTISTRLANTLWQIEGNNNKNYLFLRHNSLSLLS